MNINHLPEEILLRIFSNLSICNIIFIVSNVCHLWKQLSFQRHLWKNINIHAELEKCLTEEQFLKILQLVAEYVEKICFEKLDIANGNSKAVYVHEGIICPNLKVLQFRGCDVDEESLLQICTKYPGLSEIILDENICIGIPHIIRALSKLKALKRIEISDCYEGVTDEGIEADYSELECWNTKLNAICQDLPDLEYFDVHCYHLQNATVSSILNSCRKLKMLKLSGCEQVSDKAIKCIPKSNRITNLGLNYSSITDNGIKKLAMCSPHLKSISVQGCQYVSDVSLSHLTENCKYLEEICINADTFPSHSQFDVGCNITNGGLQVLALGCPNLKVLMINGCQQIKDEGLIAIAENCLYLTQLHIFGCLSITDKGIKSLARSDSMLENLNMSGCSHVTQTGINQLILKCRRLKVLDCSNCLFVNNLQLSNFNDIEGHLSPYLQTMKCQRSSETPSVDNDNNMYNMKTLKNTTTRSIHPFGIQSSSERDLEVSRKEENTVISSTEESASSEGVSVGRKNLPALTTASLSVMRAHSYLQNINLNFCSKLDDDSVVQLALHCPELRTLELNSCCNVTDIGIEQIAKHCQLLRRLDISNTSVIQSKKITDRSLLALAKYSINLRDINLEKNYLITTNGLKVFFRDCISLQSVSLMVVAGSELTLESVNAIVSPDELTTKYAEIKSFGAMQGKTYIQVLLFDKMERQLFKGDPTKSFFE